MNIVKFRNYWWFAPLMSLVLPAIPLYVFWNLEVWDSFLIGGVFRYTETLHRTWTINSFAHMWGEQRYSRSVGGRYGGWRQHFWLHYGIGEGWHNYHHTFPWDYK